MSKVYVIRDMVFRNDGHKYNGKARAYAYAKRHNLLENEIIELNNETELAYYQHLCERVERGEIKGISVYDTYQLSSAFVNANNDNIMSLAMSVPFSYYDKDGKRHYERVIEDIRDVDMKFILTKVLFDLKMLKNKGYLKLLYVGFDGTYKEWKLTEIGMLRNLYTEERRKAIKEQQQLIRDQQAYDRLKKLHDEGRISVNQRKELYRLESILNAKK